MARQPGGSPVSFCDGHRTVFPADCRQIPPAAGILAAVQVVRPSRLPAGADLNRGPGRQRSQPRKRRWIKSTAVDHDLLSKIDMPSTPSREAGAWPAAVL